MTDQFEPDAHADLIGLVRSELGTAEALDAGEHLAGCEQCRDDLVDTVVAHAVLTRAGRTEHAPGRHIGAPPLPEPVLPAPLAPAPSRHRRPSARVLLAAAAAVLVVGTGAVVALTAGSDDADGIPSARVVTLDPVDDAAPGEARITRDGATAELTIAAAELPATAGGEFYQAWLLDPETNKMLALGPLSGGTSRFQVDDALLASYSAVDVSLEADDGDPAHAADSVLRGTY